MANARDLFFVSLNRSHPSSPSFAERMPPAKKISDTGMWIGDRADALDEAAVSRLSDRITHVLNAACDVRTCFDAQNDQKKQVNDVTSGSSEKGAPFFRYHRCELEDFDDIARALPAAFAFIDDALVRGTEVLVHCRMGVNRSAAVIVAFLVLKRGMDAESAVRLVQDSAPDARPFEPFLHQIRELATNNSNVAEEERKK